MDNNMIVQNTRNNNIETQPWEDVQIGHLPPAPATIYDLSKFAAENCMDVFSKLNDSRRYVDHFRTGLEAIDNVTSGGFEIGLGILNGVSGAGKTTLASQIIHNMSENGQPVILFSLEMEKNAILAKMLSYRSFLEEGPLFTANEILSKDLVALRSDEEKVAYEDIAFRCREAIKNVFIVDRNTLGEVINSETIVKFVDDYIAQTGNRPVVFVDYLQRLAPNPSKKTASKMEIIDDNTELLWDYAHKKKLCIVAISSLNRASYREGATLEGNKGSGNIEYSADFGIGIQFKGFDQNGFNFNEAKNKNPRDVEIVILKQRLGGGGNAIGFTYFPAYNAFVEEGTIVSADMYQRMGITPPTDDDTGISSATQPQANVSARDVTTRTFTGIDVPCYADIQATNITSSSVEVQNEVTNENPFTQEEDPDKNPTISMNENPFGTKEAGNFSSDFEFNN